MKILLVHPQVPATYYNREFYPPSSLLYLGAVLKRNGDEVRILDLRTFYAGEGGDPDGYYEEIFIRAAEAFGPEMIGIGCLFSGNFQDVLKLSEKAKKRDKDIPIVIGGIHPTIYAEDILKNCPTIDYVIQGEGEEAIVELVNTIKDGRDDYQKIDGCAFRVDGEVCATPKKSFIKDLDTLPFPAYDLINLRDYYVDTSDWHNPRDLPINTSIPIITSRSCPHHCPFCSMYTVMGPRWRARSPGNVVDEIEYLYKKYNHRHYSFMDDNLTFRKDHILGICDEIVKRDLVIQFETPNGVEVGTLDEEVIDAMVKAGLVRVSLAIESGSDYIRNEVFRKRLSREKIHEVIQLCKGHPQLCIKAFFIIGVPEETRETLMDTYNMIRDIDIDRIYLHNVVPFPGTKMFEQAVRDNLLVDINVDNLYRSNELYITNYKRIFIKPYALDLEIMYDFKEKCEKLIAGLSDKRRSGEETCIQLQTASTST